MNRLCGIVVVLLVASCDKGPNPAHRPPVAVKPEPASREERPAKVEADPTPERKDIVVLTPAAAAFLLKLMKESEAPYLRASVADLEYKLDLAFGMNPLDDHLGESRGVKVVVDRKSALLFPEGITVDYVDAGGQKGFRFSAPSAGPEPPDTAMSLAEARRGFKTQLARRDSKGRAAPEPPPNVLRRIRYDAPAGKSAAYLTPEPKDGKRHPAIVWVTGGDCNSIDEGCWRDEIPAIDQSASAYRKAGIVMMFPALRGGNDNPGVKEGFFGEVEDVLAAAEFLRAQAYVDPDRVYLGGHSTGGTLVFLVAEYSDRFRAVFSFGPAKDVVGYGPRYNPFHLSDRTECQLREPGRWMHSVRVPLFVFEGTGGRADDLRAMARTSKNPKVRFFEVKGADHFNVLSPTNRLIAERILKDTGPECGLAFTEDEINGPFSK
jgi:Fe-S cluster assembly iron-binding protein IscA/alpha/beta superfamily hydrolase